MPRSPLLLLLVGIGGAVGGLARYLISVGLVAEESTDWPWATLTVNLLGCLLIGALAVLVRRRWPSQTWAMPVLGSGVLGGFTTYSAFAVETHLIAGASIPTAFGYVLATVVGCLGAVRLGAIGAARWLLANRPAT